MRKTGLIRSKRQWRPRATIQNARTWKDWAERTVFGASWFGLLSVRPEILNEFFWTRTSIGFAPGGTFVKLGATGIRGPNFAFSQWSGLRKSKTSVGTGFRGEVSGFRFQVSGFRFRVSGFRVSHGGRDVGCVLRWTTEWSTTLADSLGGTSQKDLARKSSAARPDNSGSRNCFFSKLTCWSQGHIPAASSN
jgi:hypothetical protein